MTQHIDPHVRAELNNSFRLVLRNYGMKGQLSELVSDLEQAVEAALLQQRLSTEDVAAAIAQEGGFMRVGDAGLINGHVVPTHQVMDALLLLIRRNDQVHADVGSSE